MSVTELSCFNPALETIGNKNGAEPETIYRVFKGMKNKYGELGGKIHLEWKNGLYVPVHAPTGIEKVIEAAKDAGEAI